MTRVLLFGGAHDMHTSMVRWGIGALGLPDPSVFSWYDFPRRASSSIEISGGREPITSLRSGADEVAPPWDVVWYRRPGLPTLHEDLADADRPFAEAESLDYIRNAALLLGDERTLWINHPVAALQARNKALQLAVARRVGFRVPNTLISNDPIRIRTFRLENGGDVIYKPFNPASWFVDEAGGERQFILPTTRIGETDLANDFAVRSCPGIYQERVTGSSELRVNVIGQSVLCCRILTNRSDERVDWRHDLAMRRIEIEPYEPDERIRGLCLAICRDLGLRFGCLDLILTDDGDATFLEVNESGQFLWIEERLPELPLLDSFCRFLTRTEDKASVDRIRLRDYLASTAYRDDTDAFLAECRENATLRKQNRFYFE